VGRRSLDAALIGIGLTLAAAIAWQAFRPERTPPRPSLAEARQALARSPAEVAAVRRLALAEESAGRASRATALMRLAGRLGWRDAETQAWLMRQDLGSGAFEEAFARADALLRRPVTDPARARAVAEVMAAVRNPAAAPVLARRLSERPWWRPGFLAQLCADPSGARPAGAVLLALAATSAPPTAEERAPYVRRLVREGRIEAAYADWSRLSGAAAGAVRNGGFESSPDGTPFDWEIAGGGGVEAALAPRDDGEDGRRRENRALWADVAGDAAPLVARQMLVLAPGAYRLEWRARGDGERMRWRVLCVEGSRILAKAPGVPATSGWRNGVLAFEPAAQGCRALWIALVVEPGEGRASAWYDDLRLERDGAGLSAPRPRP